MDHSGPEIGLLMRDPGKVELGAYVGHRACARTRAAPTLSLALTLAMCHERVDMCGDVWRHCPAPSHPFADARLAGRHSELACSV